MSGSGGQASKFKSRKPGNGKKGQGQADKLKIYPGNIENKKERSGQVDPIRV
jgi:hypothetical protein